MAGRNGSSHINRKKASYLKLENSILSPGGCNMPIGKIRFCLLNLFGPCCNSAEGTDRMISVGVGGGLKCQATRSSGLSLGAP